MRLFGFLIGHIWVRRLKKVDFSQPHGIIMLEDKLISLARENIHLCNENKKSRHVSFLVKKNKIAAIGINKEQKSHPIALKYGFWHQRIHSELDVILKFPFPASELMFYKIFNIRIDRHQKIRLACPCKRCLSLLAAYNIKGCYFTDDDGTFQELF